MNTNSYGFKFIINNILTVGSESLRFYNLLILENGFLQLDLICATKGTEAWVEKLK